MNHRLACSSAVLCSFLVTGCATHTWNQTTKVSDSAVIYTEHLNDLLEKTKEQVIDMDSNSLISSRSTTNRKENEEKLEENNDVLEHWLDVANQLREQNKLLLSYFQMLQKMMKAPQENDMTVPLSNISLLIGKSNQMHSYSVGSLGQTLVSNHFAGKIRQVLIRDRDIINRQIDLQQQQLKEISSIYKLRTKIVNKDLYVNKVYGPYVNVKKNEIIPKAWIINRRQWLNRKQTLIAFDEIKEANKAFKKDWRNLLLGKKDVRAVVEILGETKRAADIIHYIYDPRRSPPQTVTTNISVLPQN